MRILWELERCLVSYFLELLVVAGYDFVYQRSLIMVFIADGTLTLRHEGLWFPGIRLAMSKIVIVDANPHTPHFHLFSGSV